MLAELVTAADNPFFARATVNRIWFHLLGRGIVDPPDDFRDSNPSANDALLDALARDFVDHKFDVKHLIRTIVNSRTYQLSAHANETNQQDDKYFSHALVTRKRLSAEVLLDAICAATGVPEKFTGYPAGTRAVQLPDGEVVYTGGRYASLGPPSVPEGVRPAGPRGGLRVRAGRRRRPGPRAGAEERRLRPGKIRAPDNRLGKLLARKLPDADILDELFLATLSRPPLPHEVEAALDARRAGRRQARGLGSRALGAAQHQRILFRH